MDKENKTLDNQSNDFIADVSHWFFIALVYTKSDGGMLLRTLITKSNNTTEALGKAIKHFENETSGYGLMMKAVTSPTFG